MLKELEHEMTQSNRRWCKVRAENLTEATSDEDLPAGNVRWRSQCHGLSLNILKQSAMDWLMIFSENSGLLQEYQIVGVKYGNR